MTEPDYWQKNGIEKPQQVIVCAAIRVGDLIICGPRHCDARMREQASAAGVSLKASDQGFVDQFGDFITREEALKIVKENGQAFNADRNGSNRELFSEGLY